MEKNFDFKSIKSFEDACEVLNIKPDGVLNSNDTLDEIAYKKLKIICKAINTTDGSTWVPGWDNSNEKKWWPWFVLSSGFGFSCSDCHYTRTYTGVGSRLCFKSQDRSDYVATQFIEIYMDFIIK